jgi:Zn-finger nucleic acid-binding protein
MQMTCPKCHGDMRQYERSGVNVDQCVECRGIFLDRGELERIFEAEANWNRQHSPAAAPPPRGANYGPPPPAPAQHQPGYPPAPAYGGHYGYHGHYRRKKHRSFLDELFD